MEILIGSNNPHKVSEIDAILRSIFSENLVVHLPRELHDFPADIEETGTSLQANAMIKAVEMYAATALPCLADDTGLEVETLGGQPGVYSARYAGEDAQDADNRRKLLQELDKTDKRTAHFRTVICFYDGFRFVFAEGICHGHILKTERGDGGFGYDPLFAPEDDDRSFAEMPPEAKNAVSHRGRALRALAQKLQVLRAERSQTGDLHGTLQELCS